MKQSNFLSFVDHNKGDTANVFCSWIVFVVYGIVLTFDPYGYGTDDDSKKTSGHCPQEYNGYASGKYGSGAFPISLILFIVANTVYVFKAIKWTSCPDKHERKRRREELQMLRRKSSATLSLE